MIDAERAPRRKLSHEILGLIARSALLAVILFLILSSSANAIAEVYIFRNDIPMDEFDWIALEQWIFGASCVLSVTVFSILFLAMLAPRLAYIRKITAEIDLLQGATAHRIPPEGNNELTTLAEAINAMSDSQQRLKEQEAALAAEKEAFVRSMSHDIRTPLTSILSYAEYLNTAEDIPPHQQREYLQCIQRKAEQIRDLTGVLLEGSKRNLEQFEDAKLLMAQLVEEFEEGLDDSFDVQAVLSDCAAFSGCFDVQELRRIFDNLSSNIQKYADSKHPIRLTIRLTDGQLQIRQSNAILHDAPPSDSFGIGLNSIRRLAHHYGGTAVVSQDGQEFSIQITLSQF